MRTSSTYLAILCALLLISGSQRLYSQEAPAIIRVDAAQVSVEFTVTDAGRPVTDLNRYDFEVFDNGEPRTILNFSRIRIPYNMILLLDCSESTWDRSVQLISETAQFTDQLRSQDKFVLAAFGTDVQLLMDWNIRKQRMTIKDSPICHGTNFYKALEWAGKKLLEVDGRRGVIVFSDGRDSDVARKEVLVDGVKVRRVVPAAEDREFQKVLKSAREIGAPFYFVAVDTDLNPGSAYGGPAADLQQFRSRMELLAQSTGGGIVFPTEPGEAVPLFLEVRRDLGVSYSLGFSPTKSSALDLHKIEIRVRGEDYKVHQNHNTYVIDETPVKDSPLRR